MTRKMFFLCFTLMETCGSSPCSLLMLALILILSPLHASWRKDILNQNQFIVRSRKLF